MSYAIIQTGGKQFKVKAGEILKIERFEDSKLETKIEFKEILAYGDDKSIEVGSPTVEGAKVEADLVENGKNRTILIFKKRRRQNSRRKNGMIFAHSHIFTRKNFCSSLSYNYISRNYYFATVLLNAKSTTSTISSVSR